jgi:hypothetical protein
MWAKYIKISHFEIGCRTETETPNRMHWRGSEWKGVEKRSGKVFLSKKRARRNFHHKNFPASTAGSLLSWTNLCITCGTKVSKNLEQELTADAYSTRMWARVWLYE